jgi:crotonobetainyl-CoA:carnitine CoA-transferase CaiB-like acyl-CoA transferase
VSAPTAVDTRFERILAAIEDTPDDDLAAFAYEADQEFQHWAEVRRRCQAELMHRMAARDATMLNTRTLVCERVATTSYVWDHELLAGKLRSQITPAQWDELVTVVPPKPAEPTVKVATTKVLKLAEKMGPAVVAAVRECYRKDETAPKVVFREIPVEDQEL